MLYILFHHIVYCKLVKYTVCDTENKCIADRRVRFDPSHITHGRYHCVWIYLKALTPLFRSVVEQIHNKLK